MPGRLRLLNPSLDLGAESCAARYPMLTHGATCCRRFAAGGNRGAARYPMLTHGATSCRRFAADRNRAYRTVPHAPPSFPGSALERNAWEAPPPELIPRPRCRIGGAARYPTLTHGATCCRRFAAGGNRGAARYPMLTHGATCCRRFAAGGNRGASTSPMLTHGATCCRRFAADGYRGAGRIAPATNRVAPSRERLSLLGGAFLCRAAERRGGYERQSLPGIAFQSGAPERTAHPMSTRSQPRYIRRQPLSLNRQKLCEKAQVHPALPFGISLALATCGHLKLIVPEG